MKNHLTGFGIIMAIGIVLAVSGSNMASTMLAEIFDLGSMYTTGQSIATTTTATTSVSNVPSTSTTLLKTATTSEQQATSQTEIRTATLNGLTANQELRGSYTLKVYATGQPVSATFVLNNIIDNRQIRLTGSCITNTMTQSLNSECIKEVDTLTIPNGKYSIGAFIGYSDGMIIPSNQIAVYINNIKPIFTFLSVPTQISGRVMISGAIKEATAVEFLYISTGTTQPIRIGNGMFAGGIMENKWVSYWDTTLIPNGSYILIANVKNNYNNGDPYRAGEMTVSIFNGEQDAANTQTSTAPINKSTETSQQATSTSVTAPTEPSDESSVTDNTVLGRFQTQVDQMLSASTGTAPTQTNSSELNNSTEQTTRASGDAVATVSQGNADQSTEQAPAVVVSPIVQQIQTIATVFQGGGDASEISRMTESLQKELWGNVNPASPTVQANTTYQSPKTSGVTLNPMVLQVATVSMATTTEVVITPSSTTTGQKKTIIKEKIRLTGKALPNTYVTIYVYSETPTIAVVKTDRNGNWVYELNNKLADGQHEAYVTINDRTGKVVAKSQRFGFVKTAEAVTVEQVGLANIASLSAEPIQPVQTAKKTYALIVFALIGVGLFIGIFLVMRSFNQKGKDLY